MNLKILGEFKKSFTWENISSRFFSYEGIYYFYLNQLKQRQ